jgi:hypothetical protein
MEQKNLQYKNLPLSHYVQLLKDKMPFSFARYGDGEWLCILGEFTGHANSNGCHYTQELCDDLRDVLKRNNPYYHAMLRVALSEKEATYSNKSIMFGRTIIEKFLSDNELDIEWCNGDVFLNISLKGNLFPLIEQIRERRVLYVGNERLRGLNMRGVGFFPYVTYVEVPPADSYTQKDTILKQVYLCIEKYQIDFIGWSTGMASKVFIDETFMKYPEITQIDFGSMFDGYFEPLPHIRLRKKQSSYSRSYIGGYDFNQLLRKNTGREK